MRSVFETNLKISEALKGEKNPNFHPDHIAARDFFFSLPSDMPLKQKRKCLFHKFPNVSKGSVYYWTNKWKKSEVRNHEQNIDRSNQGTDRP